MDASYSSDMSLSSNKHTDTLLQVSKHSATSTLSSTARIGPSKEESLRQTHSRGTSITSSPYILKLPNCINRQIEGDERREEETDSSDEGSDEDDNVEQNPGVAY